MTIVEFIKARIDEDEAVALATYDDATHGRQWPNAAGETRSPELIHSRRHDPARVLREVAAKRAMIGLALVAGSLETLVDHEFGPNDDDDTPRIDERILHTLAAAYSDHPDYDRKWAA